MSWKPRIFYFPHKDASLGESKAAARDRRAVKRILFATDLSMSSEMALGYAGAVAKKVGAAILGVYGFDVPRFLLSSDGAESAAELSELKKEYGERLRDFFTHPALVDLDVNVQLAGDHPEETLGALILEAGADVSMVARHRRASVESFFLGADTEKILRLATRPIWVVPEEANKTIDWSPIVVAVDFSVPSKEALAFAIRMTEAYEARLTVVHVMDLGASVGYYKDRFEDRIGPHLEDRRARLRRLVERYGAPAGTETVVVAGNPAQQLLEIAEQRKSDLMIMGIHGDRMQETVGLGYTASAMLRLARFPLILCPAGRAN
ncbi:MAG: universal stress protein [Acidobacteriota bacterium]